MKRKRKRPKAQPAQVFSQTDWHFVREAFWKTWYAVVAAQGNLSHTRFNPFVAKQEIDEAWEALKHLKTALREEKHT